MIFTLPHLRKLAAGVALCIFTTVANAQPALDWVNTVGVNPTIGYGDIRLSYVDANDNLYHAILFDTDDYRPNPSNSGLTVPPFGYTSMIAKYDTDGNYQWSIPLYFTSSHGFQMEITGMTADASGNFYVIGTSRREFDANPGPGISVITPFNTSSNANMFILKYSSAGSFLWSAQFEAFPGRVAIASNGNVYATGYGGVNFIDFDPGPGVVNATAFGGEDAFLLELDASGNYVDVVSFGGNANEQAVDLAVDANGNIFIDGNYSSAAAGSYSQFDPQGSGTQYTPFALNTVYNSFLIKLNSNKVLQWVRVFEGQETNSYSSITNYSKENLKINSQNDVIMTFGHLGSIIADLNSTNPTPSGEAYIYLTSFDNAGNQLNVVSFQEDNQYYASSIDIGADDAVIFLTGFLNSIDIDPGPNVLTLTSANYGTAFAKFTSNLDLEWAYGFDQGLTGNLNTNSLNEMHVSFSINNSAGIDVDLSSNTLLVDYTNGDLYNAMMKYYECLPIDETVISNGLILTASQSGGTYQWVDCNNSNAPIAGATSQTFTPSNGGDYACEITIGSCTYLSDCATSTAGLEKNSVNMNLSIYPNPATNSISVITADEVYLNVQFVNLLGEVVMSTNNQKLIEFNLPAGSYFIIATDNNGNSTTEKLIIK